MLFSFQRPRSGALCAAALVLILASAVRPAYSKIKVNYTIGSALASDPQKDIIIGAFQRAANNWTNLFSNTFTFNFTINFATLSPGVLGSTGSTQGIASYSDYYSALSGAATSADDVKAVASLPTGSSLTLLINGTRDNPNGSGSLTPYEDKDGNANNTSIRMTFANAKAIGLLDPNNATNDATITFSSRFRSSFDFNPDDGIDSTQFDFVGIATHEIGHALGFISGVDTLDGNTPPVRGPFFASQFTFISPLDTFRYSALSAATDGGIIDWTSGNRDKYFSLDKGKTKIASFSTGVNFGDGRQASHWKDNLGLGILDPTAARGEFLSISRNDKRAFDVIGYTVVPEPSAVAFGILAAGSVLGLITRKRKG